MRPTIVLGVALALLVGACVGVPGYSYRGNASYYQHGARTANGEAFNPMGYTAAHRTLPFGTRVRVTNKRNGRSVVVRINDRGPFIAGREIDVSRGAAEALGMVGAGVAPVRIEVLR
jgi:rare lipoprotein A